MSNRWIILCAAVFGLVAFGATLGLYIFGGGFGGSFSRNPEDWAAFGNYFGGVLAPIMGFGSIVLLVTTIMQQEFRLVKLHEESLTQSHLRYFSALYDDIRYLMDRKLPDGNGKVFDFGDMILSNANHQTPDSALLHSFASHLLRLVGEYSEALALYRDNIGPHFEFKAHKARLEVYVKFLDAHQGSLDAMQKITLDFVKHHLAEKVGDI